METLSGQAWGPALHRAMEGFEFGNERSAKAGMAVNIVGRLRLIAATDQRKSKREGVKHDTIHEPPARSCGGHC